MKTIGAAIVSLFLTHGAWAADIKTAPANEANATVKNLMERCQKLCQKTTSKVDGLSAAILEARHSADAGKKEVVLKETQKELVSIKEWMDECIKILGTTEGMTDTLK